MNALSALAAAREAPTDVAVVVDGRCVTWRALGRLVSGALAMLEQMEVRPGDRLAIEPRVDLPTFVWIHAAIEMGAGLVLLHPGASAAQKTARMERLAPKSLVPCGLPAPASLTAPVPRDPNLALAFAFTSGSTGAAKAAVLSRRAMHAAAQASAARLDWRPDDRWLLSLPPAHVGGLSVIVRCLVGRKTVVLGDARFSVGGVRRAVAQHRVTLLSLVPTMLHRLLDEGWRPPRHVRVVLLGGAAASPSLQRRARAAGVPLAPTYGLTETCAQVATRWPERDGEDVGRPLAGVEVRVREGRIQVRGPTLMDGYVDQPVPWTDDGFFETGDLGSLDAEGRLTVLGRHDEVIVSGGENVHPAVVERSLLDVAGVEQAVAFGVPDEEWGERVAVVVVASLDESELRDALRMASGALARHERPRSFCAMSTLRVLPSGKPDRRAIAEEATPKLSIL